MLVREGKAKEVGPEFCDENGYVSSQSFIDVELQNIMTEIQIKCHI